MPCATQNEVSAGRRRHAAPPTAASASPRGPTCPARSAPWERFQEAGTLFGPGKAANAGGVAVSGLEMTQNGPAHVRVSARRWRGDCAWIMQEIHATLRPPRQAAGGRGTVDYVDGANIGGFMKVADAMLDQGVV